jgi:aminoglycoside phosphotransferase (APT) family kinase protein
MAEEANEPAAATGAPEGTGQGSDSPEGIDRAGVQAWFEANVPGVEPPLAFERIAGGRSNLTFAVRDAAGGAWALRRPPLGKRLGSAHDMGREHTVISALQETAVPVPPVVGLCEDPSVIGAPFFVMAYVEGPVLRDPAVTRRDTDAHLRGRASESLVDTLVALHDVDPDAVGLGTLGRREHYCARQLKRWRGQWEKVYTRDVPEISEAHDRLVARIPPQAGVAIVHGDYRLDNLILHPDGRVAAVVDWELCTLGDPLADLGMLWAYWKDGGDDFSPLPQTVSDQPGFLHKADLIERYARASGRDLADIAFYIALGYWRLAVILEGVYARFTSGAYGDVPGEVAGFAQTVPTLARMALAATERSGR